MNEISIGTWVGIACATLLTLCIYSMLYRDNPFFKAAEHLFVGLSAAYGMVVIWQDVVRPKLVDALIRRLWMPGHAVPDAEHPPAAAAWAKDRLGLDLIHPLDANENLWLLLPAVLSLFMLLRFAPRLAWLSRWSFAFIMGYVSGAAIPPQISATILKQVEPLLGHADWRAFLMLAGVLSVLVYFFFSVEHKGAVGKVSRVGTFFLMIAFGASFGNTVTAREALLIKRFQILFPSPTELSTAEGKGRLYITLAALVVVALVLAVWNWLNPEERPA